MLRYQKMYGTLLQPVEVEEWEEYTVHNSTETYVFLRSCLLTSFPSQATCLMILCKPHTFLCCCHAPGQVLNESSHKGNHLDCPREEQGRVDRRGDSHETESTSTAAVGS